MARGFVAWMALLLSACPGGPAGLCGDGRVSDAEGCDDGNVVGGDGCSALCQRETAARSAVCGDGVLDVGEACDDGGLESGDGCTPSCLVFPGWSCSGSPSTCAPVCGDGLLLEEACEDGNVFDGDGCSARCTVEDGWSCEPRVASCVNVCGDGLRVGPETCDDGNQLSADGCSPSCVALDRWIPIESSTFRIFHRCAFWTGSELLVWGIDDSFSEYGTGLLYAPGTGIVRRVSKTAAPRARDSYVSVWTGSELFIWGGKPVTGELYRDGYFYNPGTNSWRPISMDGAPSARFGASGVWTGSEVLIFGGATSLWDSGAESLDGYRYHAAEDRWAPMNLEGAPTSSLGQSVWTGREMVWVDGRRAWAYEPASDTWRDLGLPMPVGEYKVIGVGGEILVVGREASFRYDPVADLWAPMAQPDLDPADDWPGYVSTGSELIVYRNRAEGGLRYISALDRWISIAPWARGRRNPDLVWTGSKVLGWAGSFGDPGSDDSGDEGASYDVQTDIWTEFQLPAAGRPLRDQSAIWTGRELLTFGGWYLSGIHFNEAFAYLPSTHAWRALSTVGAPSPRSSHAAVWTGTSMIIWGGLPDHYEDYLRDGGIYDLTSDSWRALPTLGAPSQRGDMLDIWTGREMIVWGGRGLNASGDGLQALNDGARYDPADAVWRPMSSVNAPAPGSPWTRPRGVWTGEELLMWKNQEVATTLPVEWASYSPEHDRWSPLNPIGAPTGQSYAGVWTGEELIVLGHDQHQLSGARYHPRTERWSPISLPEGFEARAYPTATWTGREMIVWGGGIWSEGTGELLEWMFVLDGARYDPATDQWTLLPTENAPPARYDPLALWIGDAMIIWGQGLPGGIFQR